METEKSSRLGRLFVWLVVIVAIVVADQWSKQAILDRLTFHDHIVVVDGFFNLVLTFNEGAAFGFLSSAGGWQRYVLFVVAAGVSVWLCWMLWQSLNRPLLCAALSMVVGGAVGNLIDRFHRGAVVDFIDWHVGDFHWPAFNVADVGITLGVALLVLEAFWSMRRRPRVAKKPS